MKTAKRYIYIVPAVLTLLLFVSGCSQDTEEIRSGSSLLIPEVTVDATVFTTNGEVISGIISHVPSPDNVSLCISSADGKYTSTWSELSEYPLREPYRPGSYLIDAYYGSDNEEGFDTPYFHGSSRVEMTSGQTLRINIDCRLANAIFDTQFTPEAKTFFRNIQATLHSTGGGYFTVSTSETRLVYLRPEQVSVILDVTTDDGTEAQFIAATIDNVKAQTLYNITIDVDNQQGSAPCIIVSTDNNTQNDDVRTELTPDFLNASAPTLTPYGFTSGTAVTITEGDAPEEPIKIGLSGAKASSVILTTDAGSLTSLGWPREINLTKANRQTISTMESLGLKLTEGSNGISEIDLTKAISRLRYTDRNATFSVLAATQNGKLTGPVRLTVDVLPVDLSVTYISDALIGINTVQMKILSQSDDLAENLTIETKATNSQTWNPAIITDIERSEKSMGEWTVRFKTNNYSTPQINVRVMYCGEEKATKTIDYVSPQFSLKSDAYAKLAVVQIVAETSELRELIASMAHIYVNSTPTSLIHREPERGLIIVGGLAPASVYSLKATLYDNASASGHFTESVTIETEQALTVPNGGFEEVKEQLKYKNLPSGGRYSQNIVDIFNQQNYTSYDYYLPEGWANVNAKTFCNSAKNHNTWYMQPSTYSVMNDCTEGAYAVCLQSTAWDTDGQQIPDYRQTGMPYTDYSRNIPEISHRAAGKIWLGDYSFDSSSGTEVYTEGISFTSRPSALNGAYRYIPCNIGQTDSGLIIIEIIGSHNGSDIVIARTEQKLTAATSYTAFNIPLTYTDFGIKATKLKLMISSSADMGSIQEESAKIITYSDPVTSTSLGSTLWIDNLIFSY